MSHEDRAWTLRQLKPEQRAELQGLLAPLLGLGRRKLFCLRTDPEIAALLFEVQSEAAEPSLDSTSEPLVSVSGALERASVDELADVLRELPGGALKLLQPRMPASRRHIISAVQDRFRRANPAANQNFVEPKVSSAFVDVLERVVKARLSEHEHSFAAPAVDEINQTAAVGVPVHDRG